jgi:hypothetical protein
MIRFRAREIIFICLFGRSGLAKGPNDLLRSLFIYLSG